MKKPILLKQFKYSIPPCVNTIAGIKKNHIVAEHLPLMKVVIDFENGNLKLQGDWHFMMASNKYNEVGCSNNHKERVQIEATIQASSPINLNNPQNDGLVFPMDGTIKDGNSLGSCSGLVVLDNVRGLNGLISDQWNISFYLYDQQFNDCEIKFKLPIFITSDSENKN
jgi:hypothetical protein